MIPKEYAKQLFDKFYLICHEYTEEIQCSLQAKQCALLANEIERSAKINVYEIMYESQPDVALKAGIYQNNKFHHAVEIELKNI